MSGVTFKEAWRIDHRVERYIYVFAQKRTALHVLATRKSHPREATMQHTEEAHMKHQEIPRSDMDAAPGDISHQRHMQDGQSCKKSDR